MNINLQDIWQETPMFGKTLWAILAFMSVWSDRQLGLADYEFNFLLKEPCTFAAPIGEQFMYSNLGYMMLGRIISNVSGEHALSYISNKILSPLSMVDTDWRGVKSDLGTFGGLTSTLNDMTRWARFFLDSEGEEDDSSGQVLTRRSRREMQRSVHLMHSDFFCPSGGSVAAYGLGLVRYALKQSWAVGHSGGLPGSGCHMRWSLENRCAVIAWGLKTYCPVWTPALESLDAAILLTPAVFPKPFELVVSRAQALRSLIGEWSDDAANKLFSSNFFLDNTREAVKEKLSALRSDLGGDIEGLELHGERGMAGFFSYHDTPIIVFSLSPLEGGLIQELRYSDLKIPTK